MKRIKLISLIVSMLSVVQCFGQSTAPVEMADVMRRDGKIYTVVIGLVVILTGLIVFLIRVDRKIFNLEKKSTLGRRDGGMN